MTAVIRSIFRISEENYSTNLRGHLTVVCLGGLWAPPSWKSLTRLMTFSTHQWEAPSKYRYDRYFDYNEWMCVFVCDLWYNTYLQMSYVCMSVGPFIEILNSFWSVRKSCWFHSFSYFVMRGLHTCIWSIVQIQKPISMIHKYINVHFLLVKNNIFDISCYFCCCFLDHPKWAQQPLYIHTSPYCLRHSVWTVFADHRWFYH